MSFLNATLDASGKVDEEQNDLLGGKLLKLLDEKNFLNDMERVVFTPNARFERWKVKPEQINTIKAMAGTGLSDFETASTYFERSSESVLQFNVDSIDRLMDGGIDVGSLTELFGEAGSGKTQLCLQLALNCALPVKQRGLGGQVIYITTDKNFPATRIAEMGSFHRGENALDNIIVTKLNTKQSFEFFLYNQLPNLLEKRPLIKLVVIDSIAGIFRHETNYIQRAREMRWAANELYRLADLHHFAVLVTNEVTSSSVSAFESSNIACLGPSWATLVSTKLEVKKTESIVHTDNKATTYRRRTLEVVYSPRLASRKTNFLIVASGIQNARS